MEFLHVPATVGTVVWIIGIVVLFMASVVYALKVCFWPKVFTLTLCLLLTIDAQEANVANVAISIVKAISVILAVFTSPTILSLCEQYADLRANMHLSCLTS